MKRQFVNLLKVAISIGIIAYLLNQARADNSFAQLRDQPKNWTLLAAALGLSFVAVCATFFRWYLLVQAIGLPFQLKDAFRLGFLGYLLNFISLGSVGGDVFKAAFIAREQPGRRTQAIATVIVDRMMGTYSLLLLATSGILLTELHHEVSGNFQLVCRATLAATLAGTVIIVMLFAPGATHPWFLAICRSIPKAGQLIINMTEAVRMYRHRLGTLAITCLLSLGTHALFTLTIYSIAVGLPGDQPSLARHFVIVPIGMAAGGLPLPLGGLGAFEYVIDFLYRKVSGSTQGLVVALGYRLITVVIAAIGAGVYIASRREVDELLHEAEAEAESMATRPSP